MSSQPISRFPITEFADLPSDIQQRFNDVQEKAGFIPNIFLTLARRPEEFRAFFAYHDTLDGKRNCRLEHGRTRNDSGSHIGTQLVVEQLRRNNNLNPS